MQTSQDKDPSYAWVMAGVGFMVMVLGFGALGSIGVFLKPLAAEFGWQRGETALAYTVGTLCIGLGGIIMGALSDRIPYRAQMLFGLQVVIGSLFLFSSQTSLWHFYLIYALMGALGMSALLAPTTNMVSHWFKHNRGLAIGIVSGGGGIGQGAVPYLASYLIESIGWRWAYIWMALGYLVVLLPLALLVRTSPSQAARHAGEHAAASPSASDFPLNPRIILPWLGFAVVFCCITMATPIVHIAALVSDKGFDPQSAAGVFGMIMVAGVIGRILIGPVADRIGATSAYWLMSLTQTVLVYGFIPLDSLPGLYVLAVVYGLGYSAVMTCLVLCAINLVPANISGMSLGIITCMGWAGMGLGGWQGGFFFDLTGDYQTSFAVAAGAGAINLVLVGGLHLYVKGRLGAAATGPALAAETA